VADLARRCATALGSEKWASTPGALQQIDARAKLVGLIALVAAASVSHKLAPLAIIYGAALYAAYVSRLPLGPYIRRVWLAVPLFVGGVTLPVMLNTVTPGRELFTVWLHPHLAVTAPGVAQAIVLVARVGVAVSAAALLGLTTHWSDLMNALRAFFVPRMFVDMLAMTYRYAILLMNTASEMFTARTSRSVGPLTNAQGRRVVGGGVGSLFGKTLALSEEVHDAMISRGFTGDMRTLRKPVWRLNDSLWLVGALIIAAASFLCDRWMGA
jgi:cobalt ECF transporter T component CbiQ